MDYFVLILCFTVSGGFIGLFFYRLIVLIKKSNQTMMSADLSVNGNAEEHSGTHNETSRIHKDGYCPKNDFQAAQTLMRQSSGLAEKTIIDNVLRLAETIRLLAHHVGRPELDKDTVFGLVHRCIEASALLETMAYQLSPEEITKSGRYISLQHRIKQNASRRSVKASAADAQRPGSGVYRGATHSNNGGTGNDN
jgi:hypothetical protein